VNADIEFFDCNARIGRPTVFRAGQITTKAELLAEMDSTGIDRALIYHTLGAEWSPFDGNHALLAEMEGEDRLFPCLVGLPVGTGEMPDADALAAQVRARCGAVRFYPKDHSFSLADWSMGSTFEALTAQRVPVIIDINQTNWDEISQILGAHPNLPLIVLNTYYRVDRFLYPLWETHDNLYLETTTYQTYRGIESVCGRFGPQRLVFGTNLPELEVGGAISAILYADISDEAKAAIAGGTLKRLLGFDEA